MFDTHRQTQYERYHEARNALIAKPELLLKTEEWFMNYMVELATTHWDEIVTDYNEASFLYPFWQNYPPDNRGRQPKGDQFPWIEVGEHAVGEKLPRYLAEDFAVSDTGLPTGPDQRFVLRSPKISELTDGMTDTVFLFVDIKSVGPRDDQPHAVMSHNQITGDGLWKKPEDGIKNTVVKAVGQKSSHDFHCGMPPIYVLSDGTIAPVINVVLKPVYAMLSLKEPADEIGQPIDHLTIFCIPNGLLLLCKPNYLKKHPGLFFPGKDDKGKNPLKVRARVSFDILKRIAKWRVEDVPR